MTHDLSATQNRGPIAQRADLVQFVADVQDAATLVAQAVQRFEQLSHFLGRQDRSRFVHDQQLGVLEQSPNDLDPLPLANTQIPNPTGRIQGQSISFGQLGNTTIKIALCQRRRNPQGHIVRHGQSVKQGKVLEHHADTLGPSFGGLARRKRRPIQDQAAGIRSHNPVNHFDQSGLARAIFAQQGVDMTARHIKANVVVGNDAWEGFVNRLNAKTGRR